MRELIGSHGESFGATEAGNAWCIKALHPSDPVSECAGIPDESAVPSTHLSFMTTHAFQKPSTLPSGATWGFDLDVMPHPIQFASLLTHDGGGAYPDRLEVLNSQLAGASHTDKLVSLVGMAQRWRLTYCGVTLYQDGAALTNQGTIIACQRPVHALSMYTTAGGFVADAGLTTASSSVMQTNGARGLRQAIAFQEVDQLNYNSMTNMPNAYIGKSVDGCYLPLALTRTCQKWHGEHDICTYFGLNQGTDYGDGYQVPISATAASLDWPFYSLNHLRQDTRGHVFSDNAYTSKMCSDVWGGIAARNLDETTSFTVVYRYGFELQCQPGSIMSTQLRISPRYDPAALAAYFAIRRELKDAYPADFNDWAKIWKVIKQVGAMVLPGLGLLGPAGSGIATALGGIGSVIDHYTNKPKLSERGRNPLPLAQVERARDARKANANTIIRTRKAINVRK